MDYTETMSMDKRIISKGREKSFVKREADLNRMIRANKVYSRKKEKQIMRDILNAVNET